MTSTADLLKTRRTALVTEISALDSTKAGGKPNASGGGDKLHIDHVGYRMSLYEELAKIDEMLRANEGSAIVETVMEL